MKDIQSQEDHRRISIERVGVKEISYPVTVRDKAHSRQHSVAKVNMSVNLPHHFKGTHMSRFVEILNMFHGKINLANMQHILAEMKKHLNAEQSHLEIEFPYFLQKNEDGHAPALFSEYPCKMYGSLFSGQDITLDIQVPIAPPSSQQTRFGMPESLGHWGDAHVSLRFKRFIWIEDIIDLVEDVTCHDLQWSTATPKPTNNPLSVERLTRDLASRLQDHPDISWFSITVENLAEGFSTFATIEGPQ